MRSLILRVWHPKMLTFAPHQSNLSRPGYLQDMALAVCTTLEEGHEAIAGIEAVTDEREPQLGRRFYG